MSLAPLDNLVRIGKLKAETPAQDEFDGLVHSGMVRLTRRASCQALPSIGWPVRLATEPEARNMNPRKYSSTFTFSTRFARIRQGS